MPRIDGSLAIMLGFIPLVVVDSNMIEHEMINS